MAGLAMTVAAACGQKDAGTVQTGSGAQANTQESAQIANPWVTITAEEAASVCPRMFKAPDGATEIAWSKLEGAGADSAALSPLVQLNFKLDGKDFTARAQNGADETADISGMNYEWASTENVTLSAWGFGNMTGKSVSVTTESESAMLCTWYDVEIGIAYSLSAADKDLSGVDIVSVANAMYEPANEPTSDIPDDEAGSGEEHVMQTDIAGCDTFTQIVDKLTDGSGYTNAQVDGTDVLLVASGTFDNGGGSMAAIDAEVFFYKDGAPAYMGYVASGGTSYPVAVKDGKLYTAGNHFARKSAVMNDKIVSMEEAWETFDGNGTVTYLYRSDDGGDYSTMTQEECKKKFDKLFDEYLAADVAEFNAVSKNGDSQTASGTLTVYHADGTPTTVADQGDGTWVASDGAIYYLGEDEVLRARGKEDLYVNNPVAH